MTAITNNAITIIRAITSVIKFVSNNKIPETKNKNLSIKFSLFLIKPTTPNDMNNVPIMQLIVITIQFNILPCNINSGWKTNIYGTANTGKQSKQLNKAVFIGFAWAIPAAKYAFNATGGVIDDKQEK